MLCGLATTAGEHADAEVSRGLGASPAREAALRISATTQLDDEVAEAEELSAEAEALGLLVTRSVRAEGGRYLTASYPALRELATLSTGRWGDGDGEATMPDAAARRLGVSAGDRLAIGTTVVTVAGTWHADDPADPRWFGDPAITSGAEAGAVGPVVVTERTLAGVSDRRTSSWTVTTPPHAGRTQLSAWTTEVPALVAAAEDGTVDVDGGLGRRVASVARADASVTATSAVCLVLVAAIGALASWFVVGALRQARSRESAVLRARGGSRLQLLRWHGVDALAAGAVGLLVGVVASTAAAGRPGWTSVVTAAVITGAVSLARAWPPASPSTTPRSSGTRTAPATVGGAVLVAAAALAALRVAWASDVVVVDSTGRVATDVVGVLAPALVLVATGLVLVALARPLLGAAARLAARASDRLALVLSLRLAGRRARTQAAMSVLVALVTGCVLTSATADASSDALVARTRAMAVGADVRVGFDVPPLLDRQNPAIDPTPYGALPGVTSVRTAVEAAVRVADVPTTLLAVSSPLEAGGDAAPAAAAGGAVRIAVTTRLARTLDLEPGDQVEVLVQAAAARFPGAVSRVSDSLPGLSGDSGMVADQQDVEAALSERDVQLAPNTVLLGSSDPTTTAGAVPAVVQRPYSVTAATAPAPVSETRWQEPWRWVALAAVLVGSLGLAAVVVGGARRSRREAAVLRALGATSAERLRALLGEAGFAVVLGAIAGLVGSAAVMVTVIPSLAHALVARGAPDVGLTLTVDGSTLAWSVVCLAMAAVGIGAGSAQVLRSRPLQALSEEDR